MPVRNMLETDTLVSAFTTRDVDDLTVSMLTDHCQCRHAVESHPKFAGTVGQEPE